MCLFCLFVAGQINWVLLEESPYGSERDEGEKGNNAIWRTCEAKMKHGNTQGFSFSSPPKLAALSELNCKKKKKHPAASAEYLFLWGRIFFTCISLRELT